MILKSIVRIEHLEHAQSYAVKKTLDNSETSMQYADIIVQQRGVFRSGEVVFVPQNKRELVFWLV